MGLESGELPTEEILSFCSTSPDLRRPSLTKKILAGMRRISANRIFSLRKQTPPDHSDALFFFVIITISFRTFT